MNSGNAEPAKTPASTAFDPVKAGREVLATAPSASLGSLQADGNPFVSLVTVATMADGSPLLLISGLAVHTKNLERDARASLLLVAPGGEVGDPLAGARVTITGRASKLAEDGAARRRFLARNPDAAGYAGFRDFSFWQLTPEAAHLVAGFGRIVELPIAELCPDFSSQAPVVEAEDGILSHMNADHADAIELYATRLLGRPGGAWQVTGADPDGLDLALSGKRARLWYPQRAETVGDVRRLLKDLAEEARRR